MQFVLVVFVLEVENNSVIMLILMVQSWMMSVDEFDNEFLIKVYIDINYIIYVNKIVIKVMKVWYYLIKVLVQELGYEILNYN